MIDFDLRDEMYPQKTINLGISRATMCGMTWITWQRLRDCDCADDFVRATVIGDDHDRHHPATAPAAE
jgi:hypothetical protein